MVTSGETETGVPPKLPGCQTKDVPATEDVVLKVDEAPTHIFEGVTVGVKSGLGFITTVVVTGGLVWLPIVMVIEYTPALAVVTFGIDGFIVLDENPLGPVHE